MTIRLRDGSLPVSFSRSMKKAGPETYPIGWFRSCRRLIASCQGAVLAVPMLGISAGGAEPPPAFQLSRECVVSPSAWQMDPSKASPESSAGTNACADHLLHWALWFGDRGNPWSRTQKRLLFNSRFDAPSESASSSETISVPVALSDAPPDLQSIPIDEIAPEAGLSWDRSPDDAGAAAQFSPEPGTLTTPALAVSGAQTSESRLDFVAPGTVSGPSKVEFSSSGSEGATGGARADADGLPGDSPLQDRFVPPPGPIPQIATPEPSVTAFWAVSALLFACRRLGFKR